MRSKRKKMRSMTAVGGPAASRVRAARGAHLARDEVLVAPDGRGEEDVVRRPDTQQVVEVHDDGVHGDALRAAPRLARRAHVKLACGDARTFHTERSPVSFQ